MIKKYVTLRVNNITDEDLIIETTGYNINYQYKNSDLISYCNSFAPKDGNPTQSPSFKKTLKEYHWPSSKIKPCPKPMAQWLESFLEEHEL
tara:strand:+ start:249 stop:521 length:273 start_codon:yes stop_codon:yes gene_type:complete